MIDVTRILSAIEQGDPAAAEQLLPLVYDELRKLAARKMREEAPGQTLQATALVHEAYLQLVDVEKAQHWDSRGHFFAAAAEAMRRIIVEGVRRKGRLKRGGERQRRDIGQLDPAAAVPDDRLPAIDEALEKLEREDPRAAALVKLRFYAGMSVSEAADEACAGDAELQARVRALLRAHVEPGSFLEQPAVAMAEVSLTIDQPLAEGPGAVIGPYKLLQQIGEGGMGVVYMAEQKEPVERHVALKIIKPGMDTPQVIARFEAERQALAMMDHPNIARVLDAGTTGGGKGGQARLLTEGGRKARLSRACPLIAPLNAVMVEDRGE